MAADGPKDIFPRHMDVNARALLESMLAANALHTPHAADEIRRQLWPEEPTMWNVLVEVHAGGHFYFSEEQFNSRNKLESATLFEKQLNFVYCT